MSQSECLEVIAASLALPILEREMADMRRRAYGGFSTISPSENEKLQKRLAPLEQRHRDLFAKVLG